MTYEDLPCYFEALPGYFKAFEEKDSLGIDSTIQDPTEFASHTSWEDLYHSIPSDTEKYHYKLLILARHGQGYHNAALARYGLAQWEGHWSMLEGDEYGSWVDSRLTPVGKKQVQATGEELFSPIVKSLGSFPHIFFSSPMRRCLETFVGSWTPNLAEHKELARDAVIPVNIIEELRETLGEHYCDKRVPHSELIEEYQDFKTTSGHTIQWIFEANYPEHDTLWLPNVRESVGDMDQRVCKGLLKMFNHVQPHQKIVSLTCHSGVIHSTLRNLRHPRVNFLNTGGIVCAVVQLDIDKINTFK
ncbi:hypothetical protein HG535_0D03030 [Zygotorulaspora mrakii]|uniref:Phosphoglycerate mutase n=1 Tax=Zygotorulaspora mrakii TaxID=42260 RepID=A0A7H9B1R1_ZYGMR|nr:uncharacterized protein HG535_0D03030 [Zygotorulaspora mrakii]QLG72595.1 hypothetical protein HG535_0D03030 [Zygotorulaspora mrakii]